MKTKIADFRFKFKGYGLYKVIYRSPVTGEVWETMTSDMTLIDATKNADCPKVKDLERLKRLCKHI